MTGAAWLVPALPFLAAISGFLLTQRARRSAALLAIAATGVSTVLAVVLAVSIAGSRPGRTLDSATTVARFGALHVQAGIRLDGLAALVAVAVCVVALLVQIYSVAYLHGDDSYPRYAAEVSLFTAAMLDVVFASDLVMLLVGWEVMGICSYLLIGHYRDLPEARPAAVKAFLVTRVGDIGFLLGVLVLGIGAGTFRIGAVIDRVDRIPGPTLTLAGLLLLLGVAGKSAQFPLHTWLPDAMAGPTPISALIHAATMVAAGVYVVARLYPVYLGSRLPLEVLGVVAAITMLLGALAALGQDDIKRVLAWSTVSQIAYMTGGLAVGAPAGAVYHLLTHAAFKALLFLAAGCVLHATGRILMSELGGLRRSMPLTFVAMTCGLAALIGLPPLSGFFSKEAVLGGAYDAARGVAPVPAWVGWLVLLSGLLTVVVTAMYATRLWLRTFFGEPRAATSPQLLTWVMLAPLAVLAVPTVLLGLVGPWLPRWLGAGDLSLGAQLTTALPAVLLSVFGILVVAVSWRRDPVADPIPALPVLARAFYLDDVQDALIVRPYRRLSRFVLGIDSRIVDGAVEGSGTGAAGLSRAVSRLQNGNVQAYATGMLAAVVLLAVAAVFR